MAQQQPMPTAPPHNPHFVTLSSWDEAAAVMGFDPLRPSYTARHKLRTLAVHIRDHRQRELLPSQRTLEAHYGAYVLSQAQPGAAEAARRVNVVRYGSTPVNVTFGSHSAVLYAAEPVVEADEDDERLPAVLTWHDGAMFFLIASAELASEELLAIAASMSR